MDPTHPNVSYDESRFTNLWPKTKHLPCVEKGNLFYIIKVSFDIIAVFCFPLKKKGNIFD